MQAAHPFWWTELATNMSTSKRQQLFDEDFRWSAIYRLQKLNNIDKHRRLPALGVGWPEMFYWGSDEGDDTRFRPGHIAPTDDTILCYLVGPNAANIELHTEFALVLTDDPRHEPGKDNHYQPEDCQKLLASLAQQVEMTVWRVLNELRGADGPPLAGTHGRSGRARRVLTLHPAAYPSWAVSRSSEHIELASVHQDGSRSRRRRGRTGSTTRTV